MPSKKTHDSAGEDGDRPRKKQRRSKRDDKSPKQKKTKRSQQDVETETTATGSASWLAAQAVAEAPLCLAGPGVFPADVVQASASENTLAGISGAQSMAESAAAEDQANVAAPPGAPPSPLTNPKAMPRRPCATQPWPSRPTAPWRVCRRCQEMTYVNKWYWTWPGWCLLCDGWNGPH